MLRGASPSTRSDRTRGVHDRIAYLIMGRRGERDCQSIRGGSYGPTAGGCHAMSTP